MRNPRNGETKQLGIDNGAVDGAPTFLLTRLID